MGKKGSRFAHTTHEDFMEKNKSLARAVRTLEKPNYDTKENLHTEEKTCFTCMKKNACRIFKAKYSKGAVSIGGDSSETSIFKCGDWTKREFKQFNKQKVKNLMNEFKRSK